MARLAVDRFFELPQRPRVAGGGALVHVEPDADGAEARRRRSSTGSIAVLSDGIDSAEDAVASTFAFLSIRLASQPADEEHPYGHGKAESIAAAGQALLIAGGGGLHHRARPSSG